MVSSQQFLDQATFEVAGGSVFLPGRFRAEILVPPSQPTRSHL
jgi:hypothetical protein